MKDPVCGMEITKEKDSIIHNGVKYHFCCASCRWAFEKNPEQFIQKES
jgi:YHS domain-containing protein